MSNAENSSAKIRRNAILSIGGRLASALVGIAITPFALQRLGPERFGVWSLFFVLTSYVGGLDLGISGGVSRFVAVAVARNDRRAARAVILRSLCLTAAIGLVWSVACVAGQGLFIDLFHVPIAWAAEVRRSLSMFALSLLLFSIGQLLQWSLMGFQRFDLWNLNSLAGLAVNTVVLLVGLSSGRGLMATAEAAAAGQATIVLGSGLSVRACLRRLAIAPGGDDGPRWGDLMRFGAWVQASNVLAIGQFQAAKVMLGTLGQLVWVAQFELGFRLVSTLWSITALIQTAAYPAAAHAHEVGGEEEVRRVYEWCCRWVFAFAGWVLGAVWLLAPTFFRFWLGEPHSEAAAVARWLAVAFAFSTLAGPATGIARGIGAPALEALNFGVALAVNVLLGLWLIPRLGSDGAAIGMGVSFAVASICMLVVLHRRLRVSSLEWWTRVAAPRLGTAALVTGAAWLVTSRWRVDSRPEAFVAVLTQGLAFTAVYAACLWPTGDTRAVWARARAWIGRARGAIPSR